MDDKVLESLRSQALQSLKAKKIDVVKPKEDGELTDSGSPVNLPKPVEIMRRPSPLAVKGSNKQKKKKDKNKNFRITTNAQRSNQQQQRDLFPNVAASSQLFSNLTTKFFSAVSPPPSLLGLQPPPMPVSFQLPKPTVYNLPAKPLDFKWPQPVHLRSGKPVSSYVIELDTTDDDGGDEGSSILDTKEPGEVELSPQQLLIDQAKYKAAEDTVTLIRAKLDSVDKAFKQNEELIGAAVKRQAELKKTLKEYKTLVQKGKAVKAQLTKKKSDLLYHLLRAKQASESIGTSLKYSIPSSTVSVSTPSSVPTSESSSIPVQSVELGSALEKMKLESPQGNSPELAAVEPVEDELLKSKRKAEFIELERQLNKVQQELEQSKQILINTKKQKISKKKSKKGNSILKNLEILHIDAQKNSQPPAGLAARPDLGNELIDIDGHLYPVALIVDTWIWIKTALPAQSPKFDANAKDRFASEAYDSPLRWFKSSIFFDHFLDFVSKKGLLSLTFANKIDPMLPFCNAEFEFGCTRKDCKFQHMNQVALSDDALLEVVIQRLLEYSPRGSFENKADVLEFIQQKMSEKNLKGVPIVTLITRLLELRKDISEEDGTVKGLENLSRQEEEPADKKYANAVVKSFMAAAKNLPGRSYFDLTKELIRGGNRIMRYYHNESIEESQLSRFVKGLSEVMSSQDNNPEILDYLMKSYDFYDSEEVHLVCLDLASFMSKKFLTSIPNEFPSLSVAWLCFHLTHSFSLKCRIALRLLSGLDNCKDLLAIILGLAKCAIDSGLQDEVNAIFLAVLNSQMSLKYDDVVPCAQLCALAFELDLNTRIRLWIFYQDFLHSGCYLAGWFFDYPYDSCPNLEYYHMVRWSKLDLFVESSLQLTALLSQCQEDGPLRDWLVYNQMTLLLASGLATSDVLAKYKGMPHLFLPMARYLNVGIVADDSTDPICVLIHAKSLSKLGFNRLAEEIIEKYVPPETPNSFSLLLQALRNKTPVSDMVKQDFGCLFRIGRSLLNGVPFIQNGSLDIGLLACVSGLEDLSLDSKPRSIKRFDSAELNLENLSDNLLTNPSDIASWKRLFDMLVKLGLDRHVPALREIASQYCYLLYASH